MMACDKYGQPVDIENDAVVWEAIITEQPEMLVEYQPRHLYPVQYPYCEGSPSRIKWIAEHPEEGEAAVEKMKTITGGHNNVRKTDLED